MALAGANTGSEPRGRREETAVSKDGSSASSSLDAPATLSPIRTLDLGAPVTSIAIAEERKYLVVGTGGADGVIRIWDIESKQERLPIRSHNEAVWALSIAETKNLLASGGQDLKHRTDYAIRLSDLGTSNVLTKLHFHSDTISSLKFFSNETRLLSSSWDRTVGLWNVETHSLITSWRFELPILAVALAADERTCAFAFEDGQISIFDIEDGRELGRLVGHSGRVECLAFLSDDSKLVSAGHDQSIRLWNVKLMKQEKSFSAHDRAIRTMKLSREETHIFTGSFDNTVRLWRLNDGKEVARGLGHTSEITAMTLLQDQTQAITGAMDMTYRLWSWDQSLLGNAPTQVTE